MEEPEHSLMTKAVIAGADDAFVTGEIRYHDYFECEDAHILLAEIGHYESEQYTKEIFCEIITKKIPYLCNAITTQVDTNPINYL